MVQVGDYLTFVAYLILYLNKNHNQTIDFKI